MGWVEKNIQWLLPVFVFGFLISDFFTSISFKLFSGSFYRYAGVVKLLFELLMIAVILRNARQHKKVIFFIGIMAVFFFLSQLFVKMPHYNLYEELLNGNIYFFNSYVYILIFITFVNSTRVPQQTFKKIYRFFEYFLYINTFLMFLGLIFHIELFRSYEYYDRFGVSGMFSKPGEASFMYIIAIVVNYYFWITYRTKSFGYKLMFFIVASLFIGQKTVLFFLLLLLVVHTFFYSKYHRIFKIALPCLLLLAIFFVETLMRIMIRIFPFWDKVYSEVGVVGVLMSKRNILLERTLAYINDHWTFWNYILGGIDFKNYKVELELIDLYFFMGIAGVAFYLYLIAIHFLKQADFLKRSMIFAVFFTSFFSGGLLLNITAIIFMYIAVSKVLPNTEKHATIETKK
ncbi:hypothetical protein ACFQ1M_12995 [Sungkyunkwania multivorans]|uniref:Uncharacterized protein n=1 Tax=Sungkyunkwania multivorans TaxID=1173618 RepID=A0ABW3CZZ0_9FLAO